MGRWRGPPLRPILAAVDYSPPPPHYHPQHETPPCQYIPRTFVVARPVLSCGGNQELARGASACPDWRSHAGTSGPLDGPRRRQHRQCRELNPALTDTVHLGTTVVPLSAPARPPWRGPGGTLGMPSSTGPGSHFGGESRRHRRQNCRLAPAGTARRAGRRHGRPPCFSTKTGTALTGGVGLSSEALIYRRQRSGPSADVLRPWANPDMDAYDPKESTRSPA